MPPLPPRSQGFTLIELLIVVAILSTVTLLSFSVTPDDRAQLRYEDTRQRLRSLERAILGRVGPAEGAPVGGFVADNGDLPADLATLIDAGSLAAHAARPPVFDAQPDTATCANNGGGETLLDDAAALLVKGHRGSYLGGLASNGSFRDGWGNMATDSAVDARNFGWNVDGTSVAQQLTLASLGADNASGGADYAADVGATVRPADWRVPLGGWTVRVLNRSRGDLATRLYLSASLLVFVNDTSGGRWLQFSSNTASVDCLDGNGDGLVNAVSCADHVDLSFPVAQCGLSSVPQGRHLLVLVRRANASGTSTADAVYTWTDSASASHPVVAQLTAVAGLALPDARLEIR